MHILFMCRWNTDESEVKLKSLTSSAWTSKCAAETQADPVSASFPVTQALGPRNWHAPCTLQLFRMDFVDVDILILRTCSLTVRACSAAHYWAGAAAPTAVSWRAHWVRRGEPPEAGRATLPPRAWGPTSSQEQPLADGGDPQARGEGGRATAPAGLLPAPPTSPFPVP